MGVQAQKLCHWGTHLGRLKAQIQILLQQRKKRAGKRLSYHLDKCNEHWEALNLSHVSGFTYPTLHLVDNKYERS